MTCDEIRLRILNHINDQKIGVGGRLPTFRSMANEYETSIPTVQRAVAMLISEGVLFSKVGSGTYVCSPEACSQKRKQLIGILLPYSHGVAPDFISDALDGLSTLLMEKDFIPVAVSPPPGSRGNCRAEVELALVKHLVAQGIAGLIIASAVAAGDPFWNELAKLEIPVIYLNNKGNNTSECDYVTSDNYLGGRLAAQHLIENGKTPCAFVSNMDHSRVESERLRGFTDTLTAAGLPSPVLINSEKRKKNKSLPLKKILGDCKGIFGINDSTAIGILTELRREQIRVPEECGVIGFDDSELCEHVMPRLDSIRQQSRLMGERAAELMIRRLEHPEARDSVTITLRVELVRRDSTTSSLAEA